MSSIPTLHALLINEVRDLFHAENQLLKALPKMAKVAANTTLKAGFTAHLIQTRVHVTRLTQVLRTLGLPPKGKTCHAMLGLVEEGAEAIALKGPASVRDAALIGAAQRVEPTRSPATARPALLRRPWVRPRWPISFKRHSTRRARPTATHGRKP
jgi:ferritin-like metal-binding protein YciE